jgi:hypothetical protein
MNIVKSSNPNTFSQQQSLRSSSTNSSSISIRDHDQEIDSPSIVSIVDEDTSSTSHEHYAADLATGGAVFSIEETSSSRDYCAAGLATEGQHSHSSQYHDYSSAPDIEIPCKTKGGVKVPFPVKIFHLLEHIDLHEPELANIISWQPNGRCFMTRDIKRMEEQNVLSRFSRQKNYSSFRRQLNLWGFKRINNKGPDQGAYYHELFLRGKPYLCRAIERLTSTRKPTGSSFNSEEEVEAPRFDCMPDLPPSFPTFFPATVMNADYEILSTRAESNQYTEEQQEPTIVQYESEAEYVRDSHTASPHGNLTVYPIGDSPPASDQEISEIFTFLQKLDESEK